MHGEHGLSAPRTAALLAAMLLAGCTAAGDPPAATIATDDTLAAVDPLRVSYVTGTVSYPQRILLPKDAVVAVDLYDLGRDGSSGAGAPVAEKRFTAGGQVPVRYELPYDRTRIVATERYGVRARILVDGALWFLSDNAVPVLTRGNPASADIVVRPARPSE